MRSSRLSLHLLLPALGLLLFACGDDSSADAAARDASGDVSGDAESDAPEAPDASANESEAAATLVRAWCENAVGCGCGSEEEVDACIARLLPIKEAEYAGFREMGLRFDPACVAAKVEEITTTGCGEAPSPLAFRPSCASCPIYHGDLAGGAACERADERAASVCGRGLACGGEVGSATCRSYCEAAAIVHVAIGESCDVTAGESCTLAGGQCQSGTCVSLPAIGQRCLGTNCGLGASCDDSGTCVASASFGEACDAPDQCATRSCSDEGVCDARCVAPFF